MADKADDGRPDGRRGEQLAPGDAPVLPLVLQLLHEDGGSEEFRFGVGDAGLLGGLVGAEQQPAGRAQNARRRRHVEDGRPAVQERRLRAQQTRRWQDQQRP